MNDRTNPIPVLHIDDDPEFAELVSTFLEKEDDRLDVEMATHPADGMDRLREAEIECVVCDYELPGRDGIDLLESIRTSHPNLPFILYTGRGSEGVASDAISAGVTDYLQKSGS